MAQGRLQDTEIDEQLFEKIMTALNDMPANIPTSLFSLVHDLGFDDEDRERLCSTLLALAETGRILMHPSEGGVELWTPLMSSRLTIGRSRRADAVNIFGRPAVEVEVGTASVLTYASGRSHRGRLGHARLGVPSIGLRLHFDTGQVLVRIENFDDRTVVTSA